MFGKLSNYVTQVAILVVFALLLAACGGAAATTEPAALANDDAGAGETMAQELWDDLQAVDYPNEWVTVPGKGTLYRGQGPHGMLLSTYLNPEAEETLKAKGGQMPEGAIIVKENYTGEEVLDSVTVMYKQAAFDPNHSDWFWAKFGTDGTVQAAGQAAGCISCHGSVRSNDYIFTFPIAPISPEGVPPDTD